MLALLARISFALNELLWKNIQLGYKSGRILPGYIAGYLIAQW